jgi:hypothetical protein
MLNVKNLHLYTLFYQQYRIWAHKNTDSAKKYSETDIIRMLEFLIDKFVMLDGDIFNSRYTYGYKLCSSSHRLVALFLRNIHHAGSSQEKCSAV